jgi:hypothetical protein
MENNMVSDESGNPRLASQVFDELQSDRERLAEHFRAPKWLAPGFGLIAAAYVSTPAFPGRQADDFVLIVALVACILLVSNYRRATGVKISRFGAREWVVFAASVLSSLGLLSVSLGLAAAGLQGWIAAPAFAAFALMTWLASLIYSSMRERLRHVS